MSGFAIIRTIPLTNGGHTIVDQADYPALSRWKWKRDHRGYARRSVSSTKGSVAMHRWIALPDPDRFIDHMNRNKLDNRRCNLRECSPAQNGWNADTRSTNRSGYKGVVWESRQGFWCARIRVGNGRRYYLGSSHDPVVMALAYDSAARRLHGEFARLNFPDAVTS